MEIITRCKYSLFVPETLSAYFGMVHGSNLGWMVSDVTIIINNIFVNNNKDLKFKI